MINESNLDYDETQVDFQPDQTTAQSIVPDSMPSQIEVSQSQGEGSLHYVS